GAVPVTAPQGGGYASFPTFLPDGRHFLYLNSSNAERGIFLGSIDAKPEEQAKTRLLAADYGGVFEATSDQAGGRVLFIRDNTLMVQPFDVRSQSMTGDAVPFVDGIGTVNQYPAVSVSRNGVLAYRSGGRRGGTQLTWVDRQGKPIGTVADPGVYEQLALSPDNTKLAYRDNLSALQGDIWVMDL